MCDFFFFFHFDVVCLTNLSFLLLCFTDALATPCCVVCLKIILLEGVHVIVTVIFLICVL